MRPQKPFLLLCFLLLLITSVFAKQNITITIDMCPSNKPFEKKLFSTLENLGKKIKKPIPVAIALSGNWIKYHKNELRKLKKMYLDITWVNHSYSHPKDYPLLNNPTINFTREVISNIELFKKCGLKPSKYFRFPGLLHNALRLKQLAQLGYEPLDADAWLGKGQKIKNGYIVLIHGNGNERPNVVNNFINYLKKHEKDISIVKLPKNY